MFYSGCQMHLILYVTLLGGLIASCWLMTKLATYCEENWITFIVINDTELGIFLMTKMVLVPHNGSMESPDFCKMLTSKR